MTLWLYLHFPALQLDSFYLTDTHPECAESTAVLIVESHFHRITQCNQIAQQAGISVGMGLGTAAALCPDLQVYPYDETVERRRLEDIAHSLYSVTAEMSFFPPNGLLLRVTDMLSLYGSLANYWRRVTQHLAPLNVSYQYATGYSPLAARLLARSGFNHISDDSELLLTAVKQRPLQQSELSEKTIEKLQRVGVDSLASLLALPMQEVARRFDIDLVNYVGRLTGQFKHPVVFYHPPAGFERYLELLFDFEHVQGLQKPLSRLFRELSQWLVARDQLAYRVDIVLHQRDKDDATVVVTAAQGEDKAEKWLSLSSLRFESVSLSAPVTALTLIATRVAQRTVEAHDLFAGKKGAQSALELVSVLQAKLGESAVNGLRLNDDPRPECATIYEKPLMGMNTYIEEGVPLRPSFLLPQPMPLTEKVTVEHGPERIATGWWDNAAVIRDYFIARDGVGRWLWVFRTPDQQWFVHGIFS
uniref:Y-family DNA polymerase n=1 Tax=Thaumasiovibrio occultus TaxID=1891184 RepID=UPI000B34B4FC|nr:DNA polymerase Y family protein [Thaumasiovibrio occultus]